MKEFETTLDTFAHYLGQIDLLIDKIAARPGAQSLFDAKVSDDGFTVARQLVVAIHFAARGVFPCVGLKLPAFPKAFEIADLKAHSVKVRTGIDKARRMPMIGRPVKHTAGFAEIEQEPLDYMIRFALPNMVFHFAMAYAAMRRAGANIGKSDFDGQHVYPEGFSF